MELAFWLFTSNSFTTCLTLGTEAANFSTCARRACDRTSPGKRYHPVLSVIFYVVLQLVLDQHRIHIFLDRLVEVLVHLFLRHFHFPVGERRSGRRQPASQRHFLRWLPLVTCRFDRNGSR